ncbi:MAG: hypothetical protein K0R36_804 [Chryseobacterium sp.]|jgi:hypothetical protein|uniref:hypothetical protein n=1 Tax=Chryseobacterium sp. TaxID=1871047 RepID=UPI00263857BA|nr:hypothetical protein [Chryseobacterium sp.]MDF2553555.1 hypothetical protein [Chryseobacterium sp.]MDF2931473.1 hypothetical protein [Chryseobacterium sp.]
MKRIDTKEHQDLINVFERYKQFYDLYGNITVTEDDDKILRQRITELQGTYDYYQVLLFELSKCLRDYQSTISFLKTKMYSPVRKMKTIDKKNR